jgi:hypothetical protein
MKTVTYGLKFATAIIVMSLIIVISHFMPISHVNADYISTEVVAKGSGDAPERGLDEVVDQGPEDVLGRGLDIVTYGRDYVPDQVVRNSTSKVIDTDSACVLTSIGRDPRNWTVINWSDTAQDWTSKFGVGTSIGSKDVNYAMIRDAKTGSVRVANQNELNTVTKGSGANSFTLNYGSSESYNSRTRYYRAQTTSVTWIGNLAFYNGHPSPDGSTCIISNQPMSDVEKIRANLTPEFRNMINSQVNPSDLFRRWGHYILTQAGFGAKATLRYEFVSTNQPKSEQTDASVSGAFYGIAGIGTGSWTKESTFIQSNGALNMSSFGGYAQPKWNLNTENASAPSVIADWQLLNSNLSKNRISFIGSVSKPSDSPDDDIAFRNLGLYLHELIDEEIESSTQAYPSADQCDLYLDEYLRTECINRAGQPMKYAHYVRATLNQQLYDAGKVVEGYAATVRGPYVKDIYFGYSGDCTDGSFLKIPCWNYVYPSNPVSVARQDLDSKMAEACRTHKCVKLYGESEASLDSGTTLNFALSAIANHAEIFIGYSLTDDIREAMVSFTVGPHTGSQTCNDNGNRIYGDQTPTLLCDYITSQKKPSALNLNSLTGGKLLFVRNVLHYNPLIKSSATQNLPITAIGVHNRTKNRAYPNFGTTEIGGTLLSTGIMNVNNQTVWRQIGVNLNQDAKGGGHEMYLYYAH